MTFFDLHHLPHLPKRPQELVHSVSLSRITNTFPPIFPDTLFSLTNLVFIVSGSKIVKQTGDRDLVGKEGDLMIFAAHSMIPFSDRDVPKDRYQAVCFTFQDRLIENVFSGKSPHSLPPNIQLVKAKPHKPLSLLPIIEDTLNQSDLPPSIRYTRLLEPLIWLQHKGYHIPVTRKPSLRYRIRCLLEKNLSRNWHAPEVAKALAMSEATMRRRLAREGQSFSRVLMDSRLERGFGLLQSSDSSIANIALDCGFKTPSHFSDSFKKKFSISPKAFRRTTI